MRTGNGTFDRHPALVEVGSLPHDLQGVLHPMGCRISEPSTVCELFEQ